MTVKMRGVRGPASYTTGGNNYRLGDVEFIEVQSGRVVSAVAVSSSFYRPQVVGASGNLVTILVSDSRSGNLEADNATDMSGQHWAIAYEGV